MVFMVLADYIVRHPGKNHFRARYSNEANNLVQRGSVSPLLKGMENVGARRVGTVQEPGIGYPVGSQRTPGFHFADVRQSIRLFEPNRVAAGISAGGVDHGHPLVLLLNYFCDVGGDFNIVVWMTHHFQNVDFVAVVRFRIGGGLLRLGSVKLRLPGRLRLQEQKTRTLSCLGMPLAYNCRIRSCKDGAYLVAGFRRPMKVRPSVNSGNAIRIASVAL